MKRSLGFVAACGIAMLPASPSAAQNGPAPASGGLLTFECSQLPPPPAELTGYVKAVIDARATGKTPPAPTKEMLAAAGERQKRNQANDYLQLCKYDAANKALGAPTKARVVFMGDSITEGWSGAFFKGDRINRGISGQTTAQMLGRFYADVIDLHPAVVHILAGTNDVAGNTGPMNLAMVENNIKAMVDLAQDHKIRVVLGTVLPAKRFPWRASVDPVPSIAALNAWIRSYARERKIGLIDYFRALDDGAGGLIVADSDDGVHPTRSGYAKMEAAAEDKLSPSAGAGR